MGPHSGTETNLCVRVEASVKVGFVLLEESLPTDGVSAVVLENATCGVQQVMQLLFLADICP